jgi:hypothetical protein
MTGTDQSEAFEGWVILELMGHRRLAGHLAETQIGGTTFLRLDVPSAAGSGATQYYAPSAVYCITPTDEATARAVAELAQPRPVQRWELPAAPDDEDGL